MPLRGRNRNASRVPARVLRQVYAARCYEGKQKAFSVESVGTDKRRFVGEKMANNENLVSLADRTTSEKRAIASAGGKASGEARRKRKTLKEELLLMLSDGEIQEKISLALINEAINGNNAGSVTKAFEVIRDTIGERPVEKVQATQTVVDMSAFSTEEIRAMLDDDLP